MKRSDIGYTMRLPSKIGWAEEKMPSSVLLSHVIPASTLANSLRFNVIKLKGNLLP